jgi:NDP-sugar pyrophosphorylase family protein
MDTQSADIVVLCGGLGTRLQSVIHDRPKPMVQINGRPFLDLVVDRVVSQGFRRVIFCTGHHGEWIAQHFTRRNDIEAVISHEVRSRGTAGALRACRQQVRTSTIVVLNGDSICLVDLPLLLMEHHRRRAAVTVAVVQTDGRQDGGGITIDTDYRITSFQEKSEGAYLSAGIYALDTAFLEHIPDSIPVSLEIDIFPAHVGRGLFAYVSDAPLYDIGTPARLDAFRKYMAPSITPYIERTASC